MCSYVVFSWKNDHKIATSASAHQIAGSNKAKKRCSHNQSHSKSPLLPIFGAINAVHKCTEWSLESFCIISCILVDRSWARVRRSVRCFVHAANMVVYRVILRCFILGRPFSVFASCNQFRFISPFHLQTCVHTHLCPLLRASAFSAHQHSHTFVQLVNQRRGN